MTIKGEDLFMNIKELEKMVKDTQEMVESISECISQLNVCENNKCYTGGISCTGNIHINNGIDIDMCFDTIDINCVDSTGIDIPTGADENDNVLKTYFHFYDNKNGNELQIAFDDIFNVVFSDQYRGKGITCDYDNAEDFANRLKHLEEWHRYTASIVTKSNDFEIFDIAFSVNID